MASGPAAIDHQHGCVGMATTWLAVITILTAVPAASTCIEYDQFLHWAGKASVVTTGESLDVVVDETHAYVAEGTMGLRIFDLSDPTAPQLVGVLGTEGRVASLVVKGDLAYLAAETAGLLVVDVADRTAPRLLGTFPTEGRVAEVAVSGSLVYAVDYLTMSMSVLDVSDPAAPTLVGSLDGLSYPRGIDVSGDLIFIADGGEGLRIVDVSTASQPALVATVATAGVAYDVTAAGSLAYVAAGSIGGVQVVDVADPQQAQVVGELATLDHARRTTLDGDVLLVAGWGAGLEAVDVSDPTSPRHVGQVRFMYDEAGGVAVVGDHAYVAAGSPEGLQVVALASKESPPILDHVAIDHPYDVALDGSRAYVSTWSQGLRIFDISVPGSLQFLGHAAHAEHGDHVAATGPAAVVTGNEGQLLVMDVADPEAAQLAAIITELGEALDVDAVNGRAFVLSEAGLSVIDVTVPDAPSIHGTVLVGGTRVGVAASGQLACTIHDALNIIDTSNPSDPQFVSSVPLPNAGSIYEDVAIAGNHAYASNRSELVIVDISDPAAPAIVATQVAPRSCSGVSVVGDHVYLGLVNGGYMVVDVSDPAQPVVIGSRVVPNAVLNLAANHQGVFAVGYYDIGLFAMPAQCVPTPATPPAPRGAGLLTGIAPNPFNPRTTVSYTLPTQDSVTLSIVDLSGRVVDVLVSGRAQPPGRHSVVWDGRNLAGRPVASGIYIARLETGRGTDARALTLIK